MAEVDQNLVQQLEANLASFEAAGLKEDAEAIKAKLAAVGGGKAAPDEDEDEDTGSGPYEGRTLAQLQAAAREKGVAASGSKNELAERLRG